MEWESFFRLEVDQYDEECFTQGTDGEVAFLVEELSLPKGASILDMGCGTGRHSIGLARAGYQVTGIDLSEPMLGRARVKAAEAGVSIDFVQCDATLFASEPRFDAAIGLCEGAMGLLGRGDDPIDRDLTVLRNLRSALKPGGRLIINALNAYRIARAAGTDPEADTFDVMTQTTLNEATFETPDGPVNLLCRERYYTPTEFSLMLRLAGLEVEHLWGGTAGNWRRGPMTIDEYELMAVARRP